VIEARYLDVDGAVAYVELCGSGPVVLCLHTAGQSGVQWRATTQRLAARGYRVVVPDLPGHGRSEPAALGPVRDLGEYAQWLLRLLDRLELTADYVVGCSIGGKIALDLAVHASDGLSGVVAMAADAYNTRSSARVFQRELEDIAAPSRADRTYFGTLAVVGDAVPRDRAELIATMHRREDPVVSLSDLVGWATHDLRDRLGEARCPVHLVAGTEDLWIDVAEVAAVSEALPQGSVTILEGIGHYPMEEVEDFVDLLHGWLETMALGSAAASRATQDASRQESR
jgi:pimeloyl-ACP methyl ester carboxylesterase